LFPRRFLGLESAKPFWLVIHSCQQHQPTKKLKRNLRPETIPDQFYKDSNYTNDNVLYRLKISLKFMRVEV